MHLRSHTRRQSGVTDTLTNQDILPQRPGLSRLDSLASNASSVSTTSTQMDGYTTPDNLHRFPTPSIMNAPRQPPLTRQLTPLYEPTGPGAECLSQSFLGHNHTGHHSRVLSLPSVFPSSPTQSQPSTFSNGLPIPFDMTTTDPGAIAACGNSFKLLVNDFTDAEIGELIEMPASQPFKELLKAKMTERWGRRLPSDSTMIIDPATGQAIDGQQLQLPRTPSPSTPKNIAAANAMQKGLARVPTRVIDTTPRRRGLTRQNHRQW